MNLSSGVVFCSCRYVVTTNGYDQYIDPDCDAHRPRTVLYRDGATTVREKHHGQPVGIRAALESES